MSSYEAAVIGGELSGNPANEVPEASLAGQNRTWRLEVLDEMLDIFAPTLSADPTKQW
jgi:hypothetical protein